MSRINFSLSGAEHEKSFITSGQDSDHTPDPGSEAPPISHLQLIVLHITLVLHIQGKGLGM